MSSEGDFEELSDKRFKRKYVNFYPGQKENFCEVSILDDDKFEPEVEHFTVTVRNEQNKKYINQKRAYATIKILPDPRDCKNLYPWELGVCQAYKIL